jgi:F0F1-type ATP synthase delta subunit
MSLKINPDLKKQVREFVKERLEHGVQYVELISPYELSSQEIDKYRREVGISGSAEVFNIVDKSLMAGIVVRCGSKMIDLSVRSELENLKNTLYASA